MKIRLFIFCLFFIIGLTPQSNAQVEPVKWGKEFTVGSSIQKMHRYFVGKTNEHFYYITNAYNEATLRKYDYSQKEIYAKVLDLNYGKKKLALYSFIESNGKIFAILRNQKWKSNMNFYISEFKDDEFGEISQPYDPNDFKAYNPYLRYNNYDYSPPFIKQNKFNSQTYYQQSSNNKYFAVLGETGFSKKEGKNRNLALVVLDKNMDLLWQKTIDLDNNYYVEIPQFHVTNSGDVYVILREIKNTPKSVVTNSDYQLIQIKKDSEKFIPLGLKDGTIIADLGFFNNDNGNEIYVAGFFDEPSKDPKSTSSYDGLFFSKYNTETNKMTATTNEVEISNEYSIRNLINIDNNAFYLMLEAVSKFYTYTVDHSTGRSSMTFSGYNVGGIKIFKLNSNGEETNSINLTNHFKTNSSIGISFVFSFHNDKLHLVFNNEKKVKEVKKKSKSKTRARSKIAIETVTLDMNLGIISDKNIIYTTFETGHYFIPHSSFTHKDKIVLFNFGFGLSNTIKMGTLTLK